MRSQHLDQCPELLKRRFHVMVPQEPIMATRHLPPRARADNVHMDERIIGQEIESGYTRFRTIIVFAIIFVCFALVYPRFIHPAIKQAFGSKRDNKGEPFEDKFLPPRFQQRPTMTHPGHPPSNMQKKPTHHPGSRFTGEHGHVPESKGGIYFMLPLYTVGIIVFLLYTFYKILSRGSYQAKDLYSPANTSPSSVRYNPAQQSFVTDPVAAHYEDQVLQVDIEDDQQDELEENATKITEFQLRALETKLAETEAQMKKLIAQMQGAVDTTAKILPQGGIDTEEQEGDEEMDDLDETSGGELLDQEENGEESVTVEDEELEEENTPTDELADVRMVSQANGNIEGNESKKSVEVFEQQSVTRRRPKMADMGKENRSPTSWNEPSNYSVVRQENVRD
ncbi:hypothetical protein RvY_06553 [Ramazzottius varieornatus]|uniref:Resistance to inhibitors of cholinesterase protein 3 N-terminal domain-containing protein n=1 Tax=Ramazzottius varieornatus TaxID=947166 RepID=A0A1D1V2E5_RAMVA|nr:hypothetical protein RvY_06553 [Ramazzottius varieornatus]